MSVYKTGIIEYRFNDVDEEIGESEVNTDKIMLGIDCATRRY